MQAATSGDRQRGSPTGAVVAYQCVESRTDLIPPLQILSTERLQLDEEADRRSSNHSIRFVVSASVAFGREGRKTGSQAQSTASTANGYSCPQCHKT